MAYIQNTDKISEEVTRKIITCRKAQSFGLGKLANTYEIPSVCVETIIGKKSGRHIDDLKKETNTKISIWPNPKSAGLHFCKIEGKGNRVKQAEGEIIKIIICKTRTDSQSEDQLESDEVENNKQENEKVSGEPEFPEPEIERNAAAINGIQPNGKECKEKIKKKFGEKKVRISKKK